MNLFFASSGHRRKVLLVEGDVLLRRGLALLIDREPDLLVVGEAATPAQALDLLARRDPDIALIDLALKSAEGLELVRAVRHLRPGFPVLLLTCGDDAGIVERTLRAGGRGVANLRHPGPTLIAAIREVLTGGIHIPLGTSADGPSGGPAAIGRDQRPVHGPAHGWQDPAEVLAPREMQVITRLGQGHDAREIGEALGLGEKTIATYLANIRRKLQLPSALALHVQADALYRRQPEPKQAATGSTGARR